MDKSKHHEIRRYIKLQNYEKAQELIESCLNEDSNDIEALFLMSTCLKDLGHFEEALDYAIACTQIENSSFSFSNTAMLNDLLASIYLNLSEFRESEEYYLEAIREQPNNALYIANYAYLMMIANQSEKAQSLLEEAKRIDPFNQSIKSIENEINYMISKEKNQPFEANLETSNSPINTLLMLGNDCIDRESYMEAKEHFQQALLMQPENLEIQKVLNNLEKETSLWMLPMRIIRKIGNIKIWLAFLLLAFTLLNTGQEELFLATATIYFIIVVYSYTAGKLYDLFMKSKNK